MHPALEYVTEKLGPRPRRFSREEWRNLVVPEPPWAAEDDIAVIFRDQRFLYEEGEVVWGTTVQANGLVYKPGPMNHPATLIYSRDPEIDDRPDLLRKFASRLYRLKEEGGEDEEEDRYGEMLADEMIRAMRWRAPKHLTEGLPVYSTSVMICRRHLPGRIWIRRCVPLLRHRDTVATLIVPYWFWPRRLRDDWLDEADRVLAEHPEWVTVSPAAAERCRQIIAEQNIQEPWCLRAWIDRSEDGTKQNMRIDFDLEFDNTRDRLFRTGGVIVAMAPQQVDELRGLQIDFVAEGPERGFVIG